MMMKKLLASAAAVLATASIAIGAGYFEGWPIVGEGAYCLGTNIRGGQCSVTVPAGPLPTGNELIPADTGLPSGQNPATVLIPASVVGGMNWQTPRNFLGNASLLGTQMNGTGNVTCATTSAPTTAAISADRFECDANVTSGAGQTTIVTSSPTPPTGFTNVMKVTRSSGSLTQPICVWQAVPTPQATQLAGQTVAFSVYAAALASLGADNGNAINLVVITGTGTDQGFNGSWTASPAITPAWTGVAIAVNTTQIITSTFARYSTTAAIPATATEVGVGLCFTPTANTTGVTAATDGFAFTGPQLERGPAPSVFEVRPRQAEILDNEQFIYVITDTAGPSPVLGLCTETTANTDAACWLQYPVPMYKAPAVTLNNCGTACFAMPTTTAQTAVTSTCVLTVNATFTYVQGVQGTYLQCAQSGTTAAVGLALPLMMSTSATNGGKIIAWTGL